MHIVHIEDFFHPSAGYKYNILSKYMVKYGHKATIISPDLKYRNDMLTSFFGNTDIDKLDRNFYDKFGVKIIRLNVRKYFRTRAIYNFKELDAILKKIKPDILSIGMEQLPSYYYILKYKDNNFPIVLDCHNIKSATTFFLAPLHHLVHRIVFTPLIKKYDIRVIRTVDDDYIKECLNLPLNNAPVVSFGSDLQLFKPDENVRNKFRQANNIDLNGIVFVYIGKLDKSKGASLLANAFVKKFSSNKKIYLLVVGNNNNENPNELEDLFNNSQNVVLRFPTQKYVDMPIFFQASDVALFPRQCSLSFFDAQACGLPVITDDMNINKDRLSHGNGLCFESGNMDSFRATIQRMIDLSSAQIANMSKNAYSFIKNNYNYEDRAKQYIDVLIKEYNKFNNKMEILRHK